MSSKRIGILFGGVSLAFCALVVRLFQLQIIGSPDVAAPAGEGVARTVVLPAARGAIFDRDGAVLRSSRDAFDVQVVAPTFRERNLVDALADLGMLLDQGPSPHGSLARGRLIEELRGPRPQAGIEWILALELRSALGDETDDLHGRARLVIEPEGTLVRPASHARRRVTEALLVVGGDGGPGPRELRARLRDRRITVAGATGATVDAVLGRIRDEEAVLARIGGELGLGDAGEVRAAIDRLCDRHFRRVEAEIERRIDDAICLQRFGSWNLDPARLSKDETAELRAQARVAADAPWSAVRAALCKQVRAAPDFERSRYLDARKESQTRTELAAFRGDDLGWGGTFAIAGLVDGPGGIRRLGFSIASSFVRDESKRRAGGTLALLLGEVTRRGTPTGGGVEERGDSVLSGEPGEVRIGPDGAAATIKPARHGRNIQLTLSMPLQERVEALLDHVGAAAVVDIRTGGILAAATWPFPSDRDAASAVLELADLETRRRELRDRLSAAGNDQVEAALTSVKERIVRSPGFHRAVTFKTLTPPGSVLKLLTLLAGLEAGVIHPAFEIDCRTGDKDHFGCHDHGHVDLEAAVERSCNEYCYQTVGLLGGSAPLFALYERVGLFDEVPGLVGTGDGAYLRKAIRGDDPKNLAIGQGSLSLPAVKLAGMAASLASGRVVHAHFFVPDGFVAIGPPFASEANLAPIRSGMHRVSVGARGTCKKHRALLEPLGIAGKTGTAQLKTGVPADDQLHSSWFVGYAPYDAPRYAFAVLLDRTSKEGEGADAAPYAARVIDACYGLLGGRP